MNAATNGSVHTPLHQAIIDEDVVEVKRLLDTGDIDVNAVGECEKRPLHVAVDIGNLDIVRALLTYKPTDGNHLVEVDFNARDTSGRTALHQAALGENEEVVKELLSYCELHKLDNAPKDKERASPLHLAAKFGRHKIVRQLIAAGLPVNETAIFRLTPLHFAVHSGSSETVEVLLRESGDLKVSEADWKGFQPVHYARVTWKTGQNVNRPPSLPLQTSSREDGLKMMRMLEGFDVEGLRNERQSYLDAANALLVGSVLIVGIAFSSWLQPPLGFQSTYSDPSLDLSTAAPPNFYQNIHGVYMKFFVFFNTMSFVFALGSFLLGAAVGFPTRYALQTVEIQEARYLVTMASFFLILAVECIVGEFVCAAMVDSPSILLYWATLDWAFRLLSVVGTLFLFFPYFYGMCHYLRKLGQSLVHSKHFLRKTASVTEAL